MKLCVALDMASIEENLKLVKELKGLDIWLKVGLRSYLGYGKDIIKKIKEIDDFKIFLDLKIYDIPNTMADACEVISNIGVDMINLHASSGKIAMQTVMERLNKLRFKPLVLGVSALTSFDEDEFKSIYSLDIKTAVLNMSRIAFESGLDGMVCSSHESFSIKKETSDKFITLCPGIRPFNASNNDQKRVANIEFAKSQKADFIVVGRPIYQALNPKEICEKIIYEMNS